MPEKFVGRMSGDTKKNKNKKSLQNFTGISFT